jgi:hypothetical protein
MNNLSTSEIIMRVPLTRPSTETDRRSALGSDLFEKRLFIAGWLDEGGNLLKRFNTSFEERSENGENYVEWRATLQE